MIELKSPRWSKLRQAYGAATDVPDLLQRLADGDREAIWELYATICHQGTVYSASYAAVPHLAKIASATRRPRPRAEILTLLTAEQIEKVKQFRADMQKRMDQGGPRRRGQVRQ